MVMNITAGNDRQFAALCDFLNRSDIAEHPDFLTNADRVKNRYVVAILSDEIAAISVQNILAGLEQRGVPAAPINSVAQAFQDPQIVARKMEITPQDVPGVRTPIMFQNLDLSLDHASPNLGADTDAVKRNGWNV